MQDINNLSAIQAILYKTLKRGDLTRPEICKIINIARTTCYDNLLKLQQLGLVRKYSKVKRIKHPGRPDEYWGVIENMPPPPMEEQIRQAKQAGLIL